jgi:eukaryotic-like serine/threonine-protein kinase
MEQTGWKRINELFEAARRVPAAERHAFVRASTTDELVRAEVLLLLREHEDDPWLIGDSNAPAALPRPYFAPPAPDAEPGASPPGQAGAVQPPRAPALAVAPRPASPTQAHPPAGGPPPTPGPGPRPVARSRDRVVEPLDRPLEPAAGSRFGAYRTLKLIGRGAMGTVYDAMYQAGGLQEHVTLRVLPRDWKTAVGADWFRAACHLVAALDHPAIARLVDGGVAEDGARYVAMEYIAGEPIDEWCRTQDLGIRGRVSLVLGVCGALEYAHQHLVVHRSVCPANILITSAAQPMLLNCGVARLLFGRPDVGEGLIRTGQSLFSPDYASPEQVRGELMTAASDIYSVGVLLYVLLADRPPYDLRNVLPEQMKRVICESEPELPSRVAPAQHRRTLSNELDSVVMKALSKNPSERYLSATALAADLRAWLDGRAVSGFTGTRWRRAIRLMGRHRLRTAVAGSFTLALAAAAVVFGWQAHVQRSARAQIESSLRGTRRVSHWLLADFCDSIAALPRAAEYRRSLLDRAVEAMDGLAREGETDRSAALDLADGYRRLAALQADTPGDAPAGRVAAAASLDAAVAAGERALAAEPGSVDAVIALTGACADLAAVRLGLGEREAADRAHARQRTLVDSLAHEFRGQRAREAAASGYGRLGAYRASVGDQAGAKALLGSAVAGFEGLAAEGPLLEEARRDYSSTLRQLAAILLQDGAPDEVERRYLSAQALDKEDAAKRPTDASLRLDVAATVNGLALVARRRGDNTQAETLWNQALTMLQEGVDADAADTRALDGLADVRASLAALRRAQRRFDEALGHAREAVRSRERLSVVEGAPADAVLKLAVARIAVARIQLDVAEIRPAGVPQNGRLGEAAALLAQVSPAVRGAAATSPAQQDAVAELDRQTARLRRLSGARQQ